MINDTFPATETKRILSIPLASTPVDDFLAWGSEGADGLSMRSTYKLLQHGLLGPNTYDLQSDYRKFYSSLWGLNIPSRIKIAVWKLS